MFIIFGGLPGVGKSAIAKELSRKLKAVYVRIDSIEQAIKDAAKFNETNNGVVFAEGYMAAYAVAKDNLENGLTVIADSVNPIEITRNDFRNVATQLGIPYFEIEVICSDKLQHKMRVETRRSSIDGLKLPTWDDVLNRDYEPWSSKFLIIDTAVMSATEAVEKIVHELAEKT